MAAEPPSIDPHQEGLLDEEVSDFQALHTRDAPRLIVHTRPGCAPWCGMRLIDSPHLQLQAFDVANQVEMPHRMTPPACNELSATWHRRPIAKSKTTLGIPSAEHTLRN
jgi:hypothetical protein